MKILWYGVGAAALCLGGGASVIKSQYLSPLVPVAHASGLTLDPPSLPWDHHPPFAAYDHHSLRRGYQVYKQVCAACHSMRLMCFRHLVGVTHSELEAKALAAEFEYKDEEPDEFGNPVMRPGKLTDEFQKPYPNEQAARAANSGALPADLTLVTLAKKAKGSEDYVFHLLTSYCDAPAGIKLQPGQAYNPYFDGGALGMAQQLFDDMIEYEDGTPATISQMAKDVSTFLRWTAEPGLETRKRRGIKIMLWAMLVFGFAFYRNKWVWAGLKTRHIARPDRPLSTKLHPRDRMNRRPFKDY